MNNQKDTGRDAEHQHDRQFTDIQARFLCPQNEFDKEKTMNDQTEQSPNHAKIVRRISRQFYANIEELLKDLPEGIDQHDIMSVLLSTNLQYMVKIMGSGDTAVYLRNLAEGLEDMGATLQ